MPLFPFLPALESLTLPENDLDDIPASSTTFVSGLSSQSLCNGLNTKLTNRETITWELKDSPEVFGVSN